MDGVHGGCFNEAIDLDVFGILPVWAFDAMLGSLEGERRPVRVDVEGHRCICLSEVIYVPEPSCISGG
jgi:hypothetical protein